jgi:transglutaminase-like putative cysteine protease
MLPRLPGLNVALPPFRADRATFVPDFDGRVVNPGLVVGADGVAEFSDLAYPGFSSSVDLRSRGRLSDQVVMRVRASQAALWRGLAYDTFDGTRWTTSDDRLFPVTSGYDDEFGVSPPTEETPALVPTQRLLATFYVEADLPNVVFGAWMPEQAYFPTSRLVTDAYGAVRSPILLEDGVVYSVVSKVPVASPDLLRTLGSLPQDPGLDRALQTYLQLPGDLPDRVGLLADRITAGAPTRYDAVDAVETWLRRNTEYDLDIPPFPPGVDAVDHFLFESRRGFCEHIASAMTVLLRSAGVPARFVTGFGPGHRNPFTGYWEVRASDAHAWVEVFYPGAGWVPYDPTFGVPPAAVGIADRLIAPEVLRAVGRFLSAAVPEPLRTGARAIGRAVVSVAEAWPVLVVALAIGSAVAILLGRRGARRRRGPPASGAARAFVELEDAMAARGHPRAEHQTPREFLRAARPHLAVAEREDADLVVRLFERDRFSSRPPEDEEVVRALAAGRRLAAAAQGSRKRISAASATRS